jgi:hypothetical protein
MRADQDQSSRVRHLAVKKVPVAVADTLHRLTVPGKAGTQQCLSAARCIRATPFGKIDDLQFSSLRSYLDPKKSAPSEPLEATGS